MVRANRAKSAMLAAALLVAVGALLARPARDADAAVHVAQDGVVEIASQDGGGEMVLWLPQHQYRDAVE